MSSRNFCNESDQHDHVLVPQIIEVRDSLGMLAVQVLAARENLAEMPYDQMLKKLYEIVDDLHTAYDRNRLNLR